MWTINIGNFTRNAPVKKIYINVDQVENTFGSTILEIVNSNLFISIYLFRIMTKSGNDANIV